VDVARGIVAAGGVRWKDMKEKGYQSIRVSEYQSITESKCGRGLGKKKTTMTADGWIGLRYNDTFDSGMRAADGDV
jgi:hypothetical protein